ncbi:MAG: hypothetical protein COB46_06745 [Rhodospirillaceae bacterium]|nr:MAG: hypothetical protein COB46_06745 [Rhodospirillaceae bacterium]
MGVMLAAVVASPALAVDVNPWRSHAPAETPQQALAQPVPDNGYRYAPLDNSIPPGRAQSQYLQNQYMTMPFGAPNFAPQGGYRQNPGFGSGYQNGPNLGGLGGYPGQNFGAPFGGPFGGNGPLNGGWNGLNNNGLNNGPWSWMPFW